MNRKLGEKWEAVSCAILLAHKFHEKTVVDRSNIKSAPMMWTQSSLEVTVEVILKPLQQRADGVFDEVLINPRLLRLPPTTTG